MPRRSPRFPSPKRVLCAKLPNVALAVEPLESRCLLSIRMVQDINSRTLGSAPEALVEVRGTLFFVATDPVFGRELWKTNGTTEGTVLVKDINPGTESAFTFAHQTTLKAVRDTLFFVATNGRGSPALWKSDGTETGTVFLKNVDQPGDWDLPEELVDLNGTLVFRSARYGELWKSDGTPEGTVRIWDPDTAGFRLDVRNLQAYRDRVFFAGFDLVPGMGSRYGRELWSTDGTQAGTALVRDLVPGGGASEPWHPTVVGDALFFTAETPEHGRELWSSDGTGAGTQLARDIAPGPASGIDGRLRARKSLTDVKGIAYFTANDGRTGHELWRSDGTSEGTFLVKDIRPGSGSSFDNETFPPGLVDVNGTLYFTPNDGTHNREVWKSDGTESGTALLKDINPGVGTSDPLSLTNVSGTLYFAAMDRTHGAEVWKSDGTEAGTEMLMDFYPGTPDSDPYWMLSYKGTLVVRARTPEYGSELWRSDGTPEGTRLLRDIQYSGFSSLPELLTPAGGRLFFLADDGYNGRELWMRDPATGTTELFWESIPGSASSFPPGRPENLVEMNGVLYFTPRVAVGFPLWRTDGTREGTWQVWSGNPTSGANSLVHVQGTLFFTSLLNGIGEELWKSDGTPEGTVLVKDIDPGIWTSNPSDLTNVAGTLYFIAQTRQYGRELWKSDGTERGTVLVKDINPGVGSAFDINQLAFLTAAGQTVFFSATNGVGGWQLWRSDGSEEGTLRLEARTPHGLYAVGDMVFFAGNDDAHGWELWRSDGTVEGTYLVKDTWPGQASGLQFTRSQRAALKGIIYFAGEDGEHGSELWRSDGTAAGTYLVRDIYTSLNGGSAIPTDLLAYNGLLYFGAYEPVYGRELWQSDGTEEGTRLTADLATGIDGVGPRSSSPRYLTLLGDRFYFSAQDAFHGHELWEFTPDEGSFPGGNTFISIPSSMDVEFLRSREKRPFGLTQSQHSLWRTEETTRVGSALPSSLLDSNEVGQMGAILPSVKWLPSASHSPAAPHHTEALDSVVRGLMGAFFD